MTQEDVDMINDKEALALIRKKLGTTDVEALKRFLATVPDKAQVADTPAFVPVIPIEDPATEPEVVTAPEAEKSTEEAP